MARNFTKYALATVLLLMQPTLKAEKALKPFHVIKMDTTSSFYAKINQEPGTKIWLWTINNSKPLGSAISNFYSTYINSYYTNLLIFVPTDDVYTNYIDPVAYGQTGTQGILKFWYNQTTSTVNATIYKYDKNTGIKGDSVGVITNNSFLQNRLLDILLQHIVKTTTPTSGYYNAWNNAFLRYQTGKSVTGSIENDSSSIIKTIPTQNGIACLINKPISATRNSVYKLLMSKPEFSAFDSLLTGIPDTCIHQIFRVQGVDKTVKMFKNYHYTVYVPTNQAIENAINTGTFHDWNYIKTMTDANMRSAEIQKLIRILKYHFQEGLVYDGKEQNQKMNTFVIKTNDNSTHLNTMRNKTYRLGVQVTANGITLTTEKNEVAHVVTAGGNYNLMARDYIFSAIPSTYQHVDGTGTGNSFTTSTITSSSEVAIHQIDKVLTFE